MSMLLHHFTLLLVSCLHVLVFCFFCFFIVFLDLKVTLSDDEVNHLSSGQDRYLVDLENVVFHEVFLGVKLH